HLLEKLLIAGDVGTAGRADLNKAETLEISGIIFEETLNSAEALENSFGVIHAIHADAEERGLDAELFAEGGTLLARRTKRMRCFPVQRCCNADGIWTDASDPALAVDFEAIPIGEGFEGAIHGGEKVAAVGANVKTDQIGAKQPIQEFGLPGT